MVEAGLQDKYDIDKVVKFYPGSLKGPLPEDDPDHYSEWFMRSQPEDLIYANKVKNFRDIGVKYKLCWSKDLNEDLEMVVEDKDDIEEYITKDELFPSHKYEGVSPEFDLTDLSKYDSSMPGKLPFLRFHTHIQSDELLPIPDEHTLRYSDVHYELERWTLFTSLPQIVNFERDLSQLYVNISKGLVKIPNFIE